MSRRVVDPVAAVRRQLAAAAVEARRWTGNDARARAAPTDAPISEIPDDLWPRIASLVAQRAGGCDVLEALLASEQRFRRLRNSWVFWREACRRSFPAPPHPKVFPSAETTPAGAAERLAYWRRRFDAWCRGKALVNGNGPNGIRTAVGLLTNGGATVPANHFAGPIEQWYTEDVTDMSGLFAATMPAGGLFGAMAPVFPRPNHDFNRWDTSNVTTMALMFQGCVEFNRSLNGWDTRRVRSMRRMFKSCQRFNQVVAFDTSAVTNMGGMFDTCRDFNQTVQFNTARVTNMNNMFSDCNDFNNGNGQPLTLNTASVTTMHAMFASCSNLNCPLPFNTSVVTTFAAMFASAYRFNQPLAWDVRNGRDFSRMFYGAFAFVQSLNAWQVDAQATVDVETLFGSGLMRLNLLPPWFQP